MAFSYVDTPGFKDAINGGKPLKPATQFAINCLGAGEQVGTVMAINAAGIATACTVVTWTDTLLTLIAPPNIIEGVGYRVEVTLYGENIPAYYGETKADTFADLRNIEPTIENQVITLIGHTVAGVGGGTFRAVLDASGLTDDNGVTAVTSGSAGWIRDDLQSLNQDDFGADPTGVIDSTTAINSYISFMKSRIVTVTNSAYVTDKITLAAGQYSVSSINFTGFLSARNIHILGYGCTLVANTAGKNVVDCISSRWLWFWGLNVYSPTTVNARSGYQLGTKGTETCGNNKMFGCQALGYFTLAPFMNLGSETTQYYSCRFENFYASSDCYAGICDGLTLSGFEPTSDYQTITRTTGQALSFTNNSFFGCQFRNIGGGGSLFLSASTGWSFDDSTYFLCFRGTAVRLYSTAAYRNSGLTLNGLFETSQQNKPEVGDTGIKYGITFDGDGTNQSFSGFTVRTQRPHCSDYFFNIENAGAIKLTDANISIQSLENPAAKVFKPGSNITINGVLGTSESTKLNMGDITGFYGIINCDLKSSFKTGVNGAYTVYAPDGSFSVNSDGQSGATWQSATITSGTIVPNRRYVSVSGLNTITDITASMNGVQEVVIRNSSGGTVTMTHNTSKLRNIGQVNVVLNVYDSITYAHISGDVWQQVGGKS